MTPLNEYEESVLRVIQSKLLTQDQLLGEFAEPFRMQAVAKRSLESLKEREYIRLGKRLKGAYIIPLGEDVPDGLFEEEEVYELTPLGMNYLAKSTATFTSFSNISHSNIANNSSHVKQSIDMSNLNPELRTKVVELEQALKAKDGEKAGKVIEFLFDKGADIAVTLVAQIAYKVLTGGQA